MADIKEIVKKGNYIHVYFEGKHENMDFLHEDIKQISDKLTETGCEKALIDLKAMTGSLTPSDIEILADIRRLYVDIKVAFLITDKTVRSIKGFETSLEDILMKSGVFIDLDDALRWLKSN